MNRHEWHSLRSRALDEECDGFLMYGALDQEPMPTAPEVERQMIHRGDLEDKTHRPPATRATRVFRRLPPHRPAAELIAQEAPEQITRFILRKPGANLLEGDAQGKVSLQKAGVILDRLPADDLPGRRNGPPVRTDRSRVGSGRLDDSDDHGRGERLVGDDIAGLSVRAAEIRVIGVRGLQPGIRDAIVELQQSLPETVTLGLIEIVGHPREEG